MRIEYREATGCAHGQFVVYAQDETESAILRAFLGAPPDKWEFCHHGSTYSDSRVQSFNFGWRTKTGDDAA